MFGREERITIEQKILGNIHRCKNDRVKSMGKMMIETKYRVKVALEKVWNTRGDGINIKVLNNRLINGEKVRIKRRDLCRNKLKNLCSDNVWSMVRTIWTN